MSAASSVQDAQRAVRKKSVEACERCREKRIKCNGVQPCGACIKKGVSCEYAYAPRPLAGGNESLLGKKLDLILSRLDRLEKQVSAQSKTQHESRGATTNPQVPLGSRLDGVAQLNQQTGCFEYYGRTSAFLVASSLGKRFRQIEEADPDAEPQAKQQRSMSTIRSLTDQSDRTRCLDFDEITSCCDLFIPANAPRRNLYLRDVVADRHLDSFFRTFHLFLPVLEPKAFRARYATLRKLFGDRRLALPTSDDLSRPQFVCLTYAVLALGALADDDGDDNLSWASWYFAEAQDMLGRLLDAGNLQLTQAAMFLGAYAQHAIKPNLAYVMNGLATRLAFSIGLNVESLYRSLKVDVQEARRTWSIIYIQEVELSLDSGRPMSVRSSEINLDYHTMQLPLNEDTTSEPAQVVFIPYLAELAKITQNAMQLTGDYDDQGYDIDERESLLIQLEKWRDSLPVYLSFQHLTDEDSDDIQTISLHHWSSRQQSSLRIHYNLAIIILLRTSTTKRAFNKHIFDGRALVEAHRMKCLVAARDMITHIHCLFRLAPEPRRWTYYCFYCLQATLVLLPKVARDHCAHLPRLKPGVKLAGDPPDVALDNRLNDERLCRAAVVVFEQIKLKASRRCADVVRQFLDKWTKAAVQCISDNRFTSGTDKSTPCTTSANNDLTAASINISAGVPKQHATSSIYPLSTSTPEITDKVFLEENSFGPSVHEQNPNNMEGDESVPSPGSSFGLQAELYGAFYSGGAVDTYNAGYQSSFLDADSLLFDSWDDHSNFAPGYAMEEIHKRAWDENLGQL
ncbi:hypothetical protein ACN47E_006196 [Coniothyrium glycines]